MGASPLLLLLLLLEGLLTAKFSNTCRQRREGRALLLRRVGAVREEAKCRASSLGREE